MINKSPAFQFYPNDWLSSKYIALMTLEEEGAYHRLLCFMWTDEDCSLPLDDKVLSALSRLGDKWAESKEIILKCFTEEDGRIYNKRLLKEGMKQEAFKKRCSEAGKKSAENKREQTIKKKTPYKKRTTVPKKIYGEYKKVRLTDEEYKRLIDKFGEAGAKAWIKKLDEGKELKGYVYKSDYMAILKWAEKEKPNNKTTQAVVKEDKYGGV